MNEKWQYKGRNMANNANELAAKVPEAPDCRGCSSKRKAPEKPRRHTHFCEVF
jgi:hypothetical protein